MITDEQLAELLRHDFSVGHEAFREELLARCLALANEGDEDEEEVRELDDGDIALLAAAGDGLGETGHGDATDMSPLLDSASPIC